MILPALLPWVALAFVLALLLNAWRLLRGPGLPDRILALDTLYINALALLVWFVFAPQCLSTLATIRRETGGWGMPALVTGYLFVLAYGAAFVVYRVALALGAG